MPLVLLDVMIRTDKLHESLRHIYLDMVNAHGLRQSAIGPLLCPDGCHRKLVIHVWRSRYADAAYMTWLAD